MMKKINGFILFWLVLLIYFIPVKIKAEEFLIPRSVTVTSVYWDPVIKTWGNETEWVFSLSGDLQKKADYKLKVKRKGTESPVILLQYGSERKLRKTIRYLRDHGRLRKIINSYSEMIVLSEGFPVPYDYLAPDDMGLKQIVIKKKAGGVVFSYQVEKEINDFSFDQALQEGMIKEEIKNLVMRKNLKWIEVKKDGKLLVRQLWAEGLPWWVYEETPYRKSWLTDISR